MQRLASMFKKCVAKFAAYRTKCDAIEDRAIARLESYAQMRFADDIGINQLMRRQRNQRLRVSCAKRPRTIERCDEFRRHGARADSAVDEQFIGVTCIRDRACESGFDIGAEFRKALFPQRHAGRHCVATALEQNPFGHGLPHDFAEIDAWN